MQMQHSLVAKRKQAASAAAALQRGSAMTAASPPPFDDPVILPIDGTLDLHTFRPSDLSRVLEDYLCACRARGIATVKVIHGKGRGVLRRRVAQALAHHPAVRDFREAPPEAGGWGATIVRLKVPADPH